MQIRSRMSTGRLGAALLLLLNPTSAFDEVADIKVSRATGVTRRADCSSRCACGRQGRIQLNLDRMNVGLLVWPSQIIGVNRHEVNATTKCDFLKPADHVAYLRTGEDAIIGDSVAKFNASQNATT